MDKHTWLMGPGKMDAWMQAGEKKKTVPSQPVPWFLLTMATVGLIQGQEQLLA